jgi:hypothetical protein
MREDLSGTLKLQKKWEHSIAQENQKVFKDYAAHGFSWRHNALKLENARYGKLFSLAEEAELLAFRQAPIPIPIAAAISDTADAITVGVRPSIHVAPRIHPYDENWTKESRSVADIYSFLLKDSWYNSLGSLQFDRAVKDKSNTGHGLLYSIPRLEDGEFTVENKHISWRYFFPDPSSTDPLYQDMDNQIIAMPITKKAAFRFVKGIEPNLSQKDFEESFIANAPSAEAGTFNEDNTYKRAFKAGDATLFIQRLTIEEQFVYIIIPNSETINTSGGEELLLQTATELTEDLLDKEAQGLIKLKKRRKLQLTEYTSIGNYGYKVVYPITKRNIVPIIHDHRDTPYPYSLMWYLYPINRAINKFVMSSILNMSLLNSTKVLAEEKSILNMKNWVQNATMPGAILEYRMPVPGYSQKPEIIEPRPINEAFLVMPKYLTSTAEYISGIFSPIMGNPDGTPDVFSTVASLQSAGGQKIKRRMVGIEASLSLLGEVTAEFYKEYAPPNGFAANFNPEKMEEEYKTYNVLKTDMYTDEDGKQKVSVSIDPNTDLKRGFRKVRFTTQGSMGYESATEAAMLTTLATQLGIPDLVPLILERLNFTGADKVMKKMDRAAQLEQANAQLQNLTQELERQSKVKESQIFQLAKSLEGAKAKGQFDVELALFKKDPMGYIEKALKNQGSR